MSDDDEPSKQLQSNLRDSISRALSTRRPLLTHLNADTTWLLSIPNPPSSPSANGRTYWHILVDPWLRGGQSDVAPFFSQQWHKEPSAVQTIEEVEDVIRGIEEAARVDENDEAQETIIGVDCRSDDVDVEQIREGESWIDAVVICHEFTDHMHKETLLEVRKSVPVFAAPTAASRIRAWKQFEFVAEIPRFKGDWRDSSRAPLPDWLGLSRVAYAGADLLYYHQAIMVTFGMKEAEAVIYTPHGISPTDLEPVAKADPTISTLGLLHGLQDIRLGAQLNMGAHNGLKVQRLLKAKYWIGTHDEIKKGGGIVSWFLDRKVITFKEAIEREKEEHGVALKGTWLEDMADVQFEALRNGESLILE
ncbi:hypothetical protein D0Z07_1976 [Hyphodiscus hymeniophilus]|uniref:Uncharacterized protein n=1 Tax=Hyphodiscus hymeniophilus TaxID=353542 RepID=A0A9P6VPV1_9HELO|nr:hypothetical protein D0Z07_1976 [Hyphodiscus hymeniophilus]